MILRSRARLPGQSAGVLGALALALVALAAAPDTASASLTMDLNFEFSGGTAPSGSPPWLEATFTNAGANTVTLTLTSLLHGSTEFVTEWNFNFDPTKDPTSLTITQNTGPTAAIATGTDAFKADGDGFYDIGLTFPSAPPAARFGVGSTATFTIVGTGITENSFNFSSTPSGNGQSFLTAAHVQGTGGGSKSGWIAPNGAGVAPEPSTFGLAIGAIALSCLARYRRTRR